MNEARNVTTRQFRRHDAFLLSVIIPCFNEEEVLAATYARVVDVLGGQHFGLQMIFVNDGSSDSTGDILARMATEDPRVKVITLSRNFGHQPAVSAGLANADGAAIAIIDADLQDPPRVVLDMLEQWYNGFDVVYGVRAKRKESIIKRACYAGFYRLFRWIASIDAPLNAGDFSLIDKSVLDVINNLPEKGRFFRGLRAWVGYSQIGVVYERDPRAAGVTKYPFSKLLKLAADGIFNFSTMPLRIVFVLGLSISVLSFLSLVMVIVFNIFDVPLLGRRFSDVQGFTSILLTMLVLGGIQLICIGILGEYIGRIYQEVKGRPYFVVKDVRDGEQSPPRAP